MAIRGQATRIRLVDFRSPQMRAFHMAWISFFLCFVGWFGIAPLMAIVREDLSLTKQQIGNTIIASVAITVLARLIIGPLCDRIGPRRTFAGVLVLGSLPVMGIGLAHDYQTFLLFRLAIGAIGASFVVTQYHTTTMFAPRCVGAANATAAGWGNLGGGVAQIVMPLILAGIVTTFGVEARVAWRYAMIVPGAVMLLAGFAYYALTQDAPEGDFWVLRATGRLEPYGTSQGGGFGRAARDPRVWALAVIYAACFGIELTIDNIAALYLHDRFSLDVATAGTLAGLFGLMNVFARALGGIVSDRVARVRGLVGRTRLLFAVVLLEGVGLTVFSQMDALVPAVVAMLGLGLFVKMSNGATYAVVPFVNRAALGSVAGIVGAGGNVGAVLAGFLFRAQGMAPERALAILGACVMGASLLALTLRFQESPAPHVVAAPAEASGLAEVSNAAVVA